VKVVRSFVREEGEIKVESESRAPLYRGRGGGGESLFAWKVESKVTEIK